MRGQLPPPRVSCPPLAGASGFLTPCPRWGPARSVLFSRRRDYFFGRGSASRASASRRSSCNSRRSARRQASRGRAGRGERTNGRTGGDPATGATGGHGKSSSLGCLVCGTTGGQQAGRADRASGGGRAVWGPCLGGTTPPAAFLALCFRRDCSDQGAGPKAPRRRHAPAGTSWQAPVPYRPGRSLIETHAHDAVVEGDSAPRIEQVSPERGRVVAHRAVGEGQGPAVGVEDAPAPSAAPIGVVAETVV